MAFSIFRQPVIKRLENNIGTIKMKKYFIVLWEKVGSSLDLYAASRKE